MRPKLYIFDADGTLRYTVVPGQPCPNRPGEWRLMPNVAEKLRAIDWTEAALGVASNQNGVALGYVDEGLARRMLYDTVRAALGPARPAQLAVEMSTCPPSRSCPCRKPGPAMLRRLLHRFRIPPSEAVFVGDQPIDREAAARAGVPFYWAADFFEWPPAPARR